MHLLDPVPRHVEQAEARAEQQPDHPLAGCTVGDARTLPFDDESADAVLLLGPLYHLLEREDRIRSLREARRVLRPQGVLLTAVSTLGGLFQNLFDDPAFVRIAAQDLESGRHLNPTDEVAYFTDAYFHEVDEVAQEMDAAGLRHEHTLAIEGPGWLLPDFDAWWADADRRETLLDIVASLEAAPYLLGVSAHLLGVA